MMANFYRAMQEKETNTETAGKHGVKASQLEDNAKFEETFLNYIS